MRTLKIAAIILLMAVVAYVTWGCARESTAESQAAALPEATAQVTRAESALSATPRQGTRSRSPCVLVWCSWTLTKDRSPD